MTMAEAIQNKRAKAGGAGGTAAARDNSRVLVRFEAVSKRFSGFTAVDQLSLDILEGEFFALLGPSGCGKTTLLRMLAGFEMPDEGRILLDGEDISGVRPYRRPVNMMFQSYALFPHLNVEHNIAFGLWQEQLPKADIAVRVKEALALARLEGLQHRKPHQLSGGQRQRVALARCLVKRPRVLLLDEPLAALDRRLREDTRFELVDLQSKLGLTFVIVTHDQEEAMSLADRIGVMNQGKLVQVAAPPEIYEQPNSRWVAQFVGDVNLIEGKVTSADAGGVLIESAIGRLRVKHAAEAGVGDTVFVALRPEKLRISCEAPPGEENRIAGQVWDIGYLGDISLYQVHTDAGLVMKASVANMTRLIERPITWDDRVWLSFAPEAAVMLTR
jgi:putrescine transport system ATP-binding protein